MIASSSPQRQLASWLPEACQRMHMLPTVDDVSLKKEDLVEDPETDVSWCSFPFIQFCVLQFWHFRKSQQAETFGKAGQIKVLQAKYVGRFVFRV